MTAFRLALALAAVILVPSLSSAAEIKLMASNAVKDAYVELLPMFEKESGHKVTVVWGGTFDLKKRIADGESTDIVITPAGDIDEMIRSGKLATGSRVNLVKSIIGVAVRPGTPRPDLTSGESLKKALLASKAVIISGGPSGTYMRNLFEAMGISAALKPKMKQTASGEPVGDALVSGEGDIGFTQVSEFLSIEGIDYVGPMPSDVQLVTVFSAGMHKAAPSPDAAKALVRFLTGPAATPVLKKTGLEPG